MVTRIEMNPSKLSRREVLRFGAGIATTGMLGGRLVRADASGPTRVVKTANGPVRGVVEGGVQTFKGLRYAAPPVGDLRFLPPQKVKPWTGVAEATKLPASSMQLLVGFGATAKPADVEAALDQVYTVQADLATQSEDCLFINLWTPQLGSSNKRPVMVWLHGGACSYGSGSWPAYDGHNLASRHDVVVITVNHRLGAFGYLYLGELGGEKYATSGNVGQLDIVAVLEWVRDNVAEFGGDPGNVTVFGQSGGGKKISHLLGMPSAKGLFHRAIIESAGPSLRGITKDAGTENARMLFSDLQIKEGDVNALLALPAEKLAAAAMAHEARTGTTGPESLQFGPVVDGLVLPTDPFYPVASSISASVPVMLGCTRDEQTVYNVGKPWWGKISDAELEQKAREAVGDKAPALIAAFRKLRPGDSPSYLYSDTTTADQAFMNCIRMAERKTALKSAPAYFYIYQYPEYVDDGDLGAPHMSEILYAFDNLDKGPLLVGPVSRSQALADQVSRTWVAFARNGNPNHPGLPHWPSYNVEERPTMTFDLPSSKVVNDPEGEIRKILES
ncbi:MAG: carboxylesterase/lipase family protein [Terracidiphilus sp.]